MHDFVPDQVEGDLLKMIPVEPIKPFPGIKGFDPRNSDGLTFIRAAEPVGSRVTCDPPPADTDEDWLVLAFDKYEFAHMLKAEYGFEEGGSDLADMEDFDEEMSFQSMTLGKLNLIITQTSQFYRRFLAASRLAKRFNLLEKEDRIALFQAVLYGNACEPKTP